MAYKKKIEQRFTDTEHVDYEFGHMIARCKNNAKSSLFLLVFFAALTIMMFALYFDPETSTKTPCLIIGVIFVFVDIYLISTFFDEYCFYEYGFVRNVLWKAKKVMVSYDDITSLCERNSVLVGRRTARNVRYFDIQLGNDKKAVSIEATNYQVIYSVLTFIAKELDFGGQAEQTD